MKKAGIITFHSSNNYGAFLQAYCLREAIVKYTGLECEIIDYEPASNSRKNSANIGKGVESAKELLFNIKRFRMFRKAREKYLAMSPHVTDSKGDDVVKFMLDNYDIVITGSDEVWKIGKERGFPNIYWLQGIAGPCKIAYAVSSRVDPSTLDDKKLVQIRELIDSFSYIGVRDTPTQELVESLALPHSKVHMNCDPTFLMDFHLSKEVCRAFIRKKFGVSGRRKIIALMVEQRDLGNRIVELYGHSFDFISLYHYYPGTRGFFVPDPFEWMEAIAGCDGLVSTFFHGTVFAIKNNTPFLAIEGREITSPHFSKQFDLLKRNGLEERFCMLSNVGADELALRNVGSFLADVLQNGTAVNYSSVCENEKKLAAPFWDYFKSDLKRHFAKDREECCGCGACAFSCPAHAITMVEDQEGFRYPEIDAGKCNACGLCKLSCAFTYNWQGARHFAPNTRSAYAARHMDDDIRMNSRSGGAFAALADAILHRNGIVYGAAFTDGWTVRHIRVTELEERTRLQKSKYVQSMMDDVYPQIKADLKSGRPVLFSGTPCQVASIKNFLRNDNTDNLFCIDILCLGVPSPAIWRDYLGLLAKKHKGAVTNAEFRNKKDFGWAEHVTTVWIENEPCSGKDYPLMYSSHDNMRPSCYFCKFKDRERTGDITLGDFWGIDRIMPEFNDNKGTSLVLVNSDKGERLFSLAKDLDARPCDAGMVRSNSLESPYPCPETRSDFWNNYKRHGIGCVIKQKSRERKRKKAMKRIDNLKVHIANCRRRAWKLIIKAFS